VRALPWARQARARSADDAEPGAGLLALRAGGGEAVTSKIERYWAEPKRLWSPGLTPQEDFIEAIRAGDFRIEWRTPLTPRALRRRARKIARRAARRQRLKP
jgi:hypothetical protein